VEANRLGAAELVRKNTDFVMHVEQKEKSLVMQFFILGVKDKIRKGGFNEFSNY